MTQTVPDLPETKKEIITEAHRTLHSMQALMADENTAIEAQNTKAVETVLPNKKKLSIRLERLINALKTHQGDTDAEVSAAAEAFKADMAAFQTAALDNVTQLKAAHQVRADVLTMLKDTVTTLNSPQTYGADGAPSTAPGLPAHLMGKDV